MRTIANLLDLATSIGHDMAEFAGGHATFFVVAAVVAFGALALAWRSGRL